MDKTLQAWQLHLDVSPDYDQCVMQPNSWLAPALLRETCKCIHCNEYRYTTYTVDLILRLMLHTFMSISNYSLLHCLQKGTISRAEGTQGNVYL